MRLQFAGESLLGRYSAADMDNRLAALEKRDLCPGECELTGRL